jgi:hypothetical protein
LGSRANTQQSKPASLPPKLVEALKTGSHPIEEQSELGRGLFTSKDWRKAWYTYESPPHESDLINPKTGYAEYTIDESMIDGKIPDDLVGCLYRNGPGKFGVGEIELSTFSMPMVSLSKFYSLPKTKTGIQIHVEVRGDRSHEGGRTCQRVSVSINVRDGTERVCETAQKWSQRRSLAGSFAVQNSWECTQS